MPPYVDRIRQWDVKHKYYQRKQGVDTIRTCPPLPPPEEILPAVRSRRRAGGASAAEEAA